MDETLACKAQKVFAAAAPHDWPEPQAEIQENELLLVVDLPDEWEMIQVTRDERRAIALALNSLMPSAELLGIWTVVLRWRGSVVDSVLSIDL